MNKLMRFLGLGDNKEPLSHVGTSVEAALRSQHWNQRRSTWSVSSGSVVGEVAQTPPRECWGEATPHWHSDEFPRRLYDIIVKAHDFVDITSLDPPDGMFEDAIRDAIAEVASQGRPVTFRLLFGYVPLRPTDCEDILSKLISKVPENSKVKVWCAALRKDLTWNHSKIIAVDGRHLFQGGHNLDTDHYLKNNPVHDLSIELQGHVALDAHYYVNKLWQSVAENDVSYMRCVPQWLETPTEVRVNVSQFPGLTSRLPPKYVASKKLPRREDSDVPMITVGRLGALHKFRIGANPSDSAITAMLRSARKTIRLSQQDIGPVMHPFNVPLTGKLCHLPGQVWPASYLRELGHAMRRGVSVSIALSNVGAIPANLTDTLDEFSNGWTSADVAAEIVKAMQQDGDKELGDCEMKDLIARNLHVTTIHQKGGAVDYPDGRHIPNHAKFVMVDDTCFYIGSQNMYVCDLAEWGVIVDNADEAERVLQQYWWPMWGQSAFAQCSVEDVVDGLATDRSTRPDPHGCVPDSSLPAY